MARRKKADTQKIWEAYQAQKLAEQKRDELNSIASSIKEVFVNGSIKNAIKAVELGTNIRFVGNGEGKRFITFFFKD